MKKNLSPIEIGNIGEKYTVKHLRRKGYKILDRNMRNYYSEIDIIAENKEYIVFVEVKTRTEGQLYPPRAAVNAEKRKKILSASRSYIKYKGINKKVRYDISEVYLTKEKHKISSINYIERAFDKWRSYATF